MATAATIEATCSIPLHAMEDGAPTSTAEETIDITEYRFFRWLDLQGRAGRVSILSRRMKMLAAGLIGAAVGPDCLTWVPHDPPPRQDLGGMTNLDGRVPS